MNINFSHYFHSIVGYKEKLSASLTPQQKKIAAIVAVAFSCLAAIYLTKRWISSINQKKIKDGQFIDFLLNPRENLLAFPPPDFIFTDSNGKPLEGEAKGEYQGKIFEGQFTAGYLNGRGKITGPSNMGVLEGDFLKNQLNGAGAMTFPMLKTGKTLHAWAQVNGKIHMPRLDGSLLEVNTQAGGVHIKPTKLVSKEPFEIRESCEVWGGDRSIGYLFHLPCLPQYRKANGSPFEGRGSFTSNKDTYEGWFTQGLLNGFGTITRANGTILEGNFRDGVLSGRGKIIKSDGRTWEGLFQEGKCVFTYPGTVWFEGQGNFDFLGTRFEGHFKDGKLNGQGTITEPNGTVYQGEFLNNFLNGSGKITYSDGTIVEGIFNQGFLIPEEKP